jgi:hypothetical protein
MKEKPRKHFFQMIARTTYLFFIKPADCSGLVSIPHSLNSLNWRVNAYLAVFSLLALHLPAEGNDMKERYLLILIIVFVLGSKIVIAEQVTPSELLDRYAANLKVIEMHHIKSEEISEFTDSLEPEKNKLNRLEYESIQNGQLRELTTKKSVIKMNDEGSVISNENLQIDTVIWDGQEWSQASNIPPLTPSAFFSKTDEKKAYSTLSLTYCGACLDGIFWGDMERIDSILKKSSKIGILPDMEKVNGSDCYVIESVTPHGEYKIWIDPEHGYNIAKAETHKTNNDILYNGVTKHEYADMSPGRGYKGKRPKSRDAVHFYMDNVSFRKVNDVWLPMEAAYRIIVDYNDRKATYKKHHERTYVKLKPDFEAIKAFIPKIPEGSTVILDWSPGIRYTWQNGKPVADVDKGVLEVILDEIILD